MKQKEIKWYGWKKDAVDPRDICYKVKKLVPIQSVDLRKTCTMPAIMDQGDLGSCTANAISFALSFNALNKHVQKAVKCKLPFSRLFIYYNERVIEGTVNSDSGAEIRDGIKSVAQVGAPPESLCKYSISRFAKKPSATAYKSALQFKAVQYERLDNKNKSMLVDCLQRGYPFVFGFTVFESFESDAVAATGIVPMPNIKSEQMLGGHAVMCVGYDLPTDRFIVANSWGADWGQKGYFTIPAAYLCNPNLADDFWMIDTIN